MNVTEASSEVLDDSGGADAGETAPAGGSELEAGEGEAGARGTSRGAQSRCHPA